MGWSLVGCQQCKSAELKAIMVLQVTIDSQGLMKVTHMMNLQGGPRALGGTFQGMAAFAETQRTSNTNTGVVRFLSAPEDVFAEE